MMISRRGARPHLLSQSAYDEALLENEDAFDLTPSDAELETIDQFRTQGVDVSHLITSHPEKDQEGKREREERAKFERWMDLLDGTVGSDGTVELGEEKKDEILEALKGIEECCSGKRRGTVSQSLPVSSGDAGDKLEEAKGDGLEEGPDADAVGDGDDDDGGDRSEEADDVVGPLPTTTAATDNSNPSVAAATSKGEKSHPGLPYLISIERSESVYTLMSLLGAVALPSDEAADADANAAADDADANANACRIPPEAEEVLIATCRCLTSILTPPLRSDGNAVRETKDSLRDAFGPALGRVVGLIQLYADRARRGEGDETERGAANAATRVLTDLVRLSVASVRNCESNKASFVKAGRGKGDSSGVAAVVRCLSLPPLADSEGDSDDAPPPSSSDRLALLTESCRLVAVLCRFDDFRQPPPQQGGGGGGGPAGMLPAASSAHDHATEFHRSGAVPALRRIAEVALPLPGEGSGEGEGDGEGDGPAPQLELAAAVLSATRALAVNDEVVQSLVAVGTLDVARRALRIGAGAGDAGAEASAPDDGEAAGEVSSEGGAQNSAPTLKKQRKQREALTAAALGLVRNLCGNDEIKTTLCLGSSGPPPYPPLLPSILRAMRTYKSAVRVQEHGLGTLAAMALRRPGNASKIVECGGCRDILTGMRMHPGCVPVQRQGALAVRNVASRLVGREGGNNDGSLADGSGNGTAGTGATAPANAALDVRETFLELGAESVLREIAGRHQGSVDEAYAALRDLGCKVSMVKIDADKLAAGEVDVTSTSGRTPMFGDVKPKFNPVFEESRELAGSGGMEGRIAQHAMG